MKTVGPWMRKPTMTVGEMIAELSKYPSDMPVIADWETTHNPFLPNSFILDADSIPGETFLCIDVDTH